jgi:hypothetical protein
VHDALLDCYLRESTAIKSDSASNSKLAAEAKARAIQFLSHQEV